MIHAPSIKLTVRHAIVIGGTVVSQVGEAAVGGIAREFVNRTAAA